MNFEYLLDKEKGRAWILRIANNVLRDYYRMKMKSIVDYVQPEVFINLGKGKSGRTYYEELSFALDELSHEEKSAIKLFYYDGFDQEEIARNSKVSVEQ